VVCLADGVDRLIDSYLSSVGSIGRANQSNCLTVHLSGCLSVWLSVYLSNYSWMGGRTVGWMNG